MDRHELPSHESTREVGLENLGTSHFVISFGCTTQPE